MCSYLLVSPNMKCTTFINYTYEEYDKYGLGLGGARGHMPILNRKHTKKISISG